MDPAVSIYISPEPPPLQQDVGITDLSHQCHSDSGVLPTVQTRVSYSGGRAAPRKDDVCLKVTMRALMRKHVAGQNPLSEKHTASPRGSRTNNEAAPDSIQLSS